MAGAAVVFSGCDSCVFANNTIVHPGSQVARIVQENPERAVGADGHFTNNVVVFAESRLRGHVDVAAGTRPETYTFGANLWYAVDDEKFAGPDYPSGIPAEQGAVVGRNPLLDAARRPKEGSPAFTAGREVPGGRAVGFRAAPLPQSAQQGGVRGAVKGERD